MTVSRFSKIGDVLKSPGNSTPDAFKLTRDASFSCEVISSIPLVLPYRKDVADVGTGVDNAPYTCDDVALTIRGGAALVGATVENQPAVVSMNWNSSCCSHPMHPPATVSQRYKHEHTYQ